jgi:uncharacterized protein YecE (DUF72 family)
MDLYINPVTSRILIGTASWTDKTLIACGRFYPPGCNTAQARLRHYATQFPLVEVDSSYYGMPTPRNAQLWAERTPSDFVFNVKAFRLFTGHATSPASLHKDLQLALGPQPPQVLYYGTTPAEIREALWHRFIEALAPLKSAGKLGLLHFQFAPWVIGSREGRDHVAHCVEKVPGHVLAAEFRHRSWFEGAQAEDTLAFERGLGLVHTVVDSPQGFDNTVPAVWAVTHPQHALVRLHGRNHAAWNHRGPASSGRFDHWYSQAEIDSLVEPVRRIAAQAPQTHVVFNTNNQDQGMVNARLLAEAMGLGAERRISTT